MTVPDRARPRGRYAATDLAGRREAVVAEAAKAFLELGFAGASFEVIARRASVSPKTIYAWFGGKPGLLAAVMEQMGREELMNGLADCLSSEADAAKALRAFSLRLLEMVLSPNVIELQRIVIAEASRLPEVAELFYETGPRQAIALLAKFIEERGFSLETESPNAYHDAEILVSAMTGELTRRVLLGIAPRPQRNVLEHHVDQVLARMWLLR